MGGIHPQLKRPVGRRLAIAAVNLLPKYRSYAGVLPLRPDPLEHPVYTVTALPLVSSL